MPRKFEMVAPNGCRVMTHWVKHGWTLTTGMESFSILSVLINFKSILDQNFPMSERLNAHMNNHMCIP